MELKELKRVQKENERLCSTVSALTLGKFILSEVAKGKFDAPQGGATA